MLDFPRIVVAEPVGENDLLERLVKKPCLAAVGPGLWKLMLVEDAKPHAWSSVDSVTIELTECLGPTERTSASCAKVAQGPLGEQVRVPCAKSLPLRARRDQHLHALEAMHERRVGAHRFADELDPREALQDLFPDDRQLHLRDAVADAAMHAETEGHVMPWPFAVDLEGVAILDHRFVAVARDVPHRDRVALLNGLAAELDVFHGQAAHMRERRLPPDRFGDH